MKRLSRLLTLLLLPVFAFAANTDTSAVSLARDTAWYHLLVEQAGSKLQQQIALNEHLKQEGRESEMQFVINITPNGGAPYLIDEGVGEGAAMLKDYRIVKDTLESHLKKLYSSYHVEAYLILLNYFTLKMKYELKGNYTVDDIFNSNLLNDTLNIQELKNQHEMITNGIAYTQGIFADTSARIVLSVGVYKGLAADSIATTYFCSKIKPNKNNGYISKQVAPLLYSYLQYTDADPKDGSFAYPRYHVSSLEKAVASSRQKAKILQTLTVPGMIGILEQFSGMADYAALSVEERLHIMSVLLTEKLRGDYMINQNGEGAVIKILESTPPAQVEDLLAGLEKPSTLNSNSNYEGDKTNKKPIIVRLDKEVDDKLLFVGGANYTRMMTALKNLIVSSPKFTDKLVAILSNPDTLDAHTVQWKFADIGGHVDIGFTEVDDVDLNDAGNVIVSQSKVIGKTERQNPAGDDMGGYDLDWDFNVPDKVFHPFDLIAFTNFTDLGILNDAAEVKKGEMVFVPAVFLEYADHKKLADEITTGVVTVIDVATLVTGPGAVVSAVGWIRKGFVIYTMANAAANLAMNATPPEMRDSGFVEVLDMSNKVMLVIGATQLVKGGIKTIPAAIRTAKSISGKLGRDMALNFVMAVMRAEDRMKSLNSASKVVDEIFALRNRIVSEWKIRTGEDLIAAARAALPNAIIKFKAGWSKAKVLLNPKGSRPPYTDYLEQPYVDAHLSAFNNEGGAFLAPKSWVENGNYLTFPPKKYVLLQSEMDKIEAMFVKAGRDPAVFEETLSLPKGCLNGEELYIFKVEKGRFKFDMTTGNEAGANSFYQPGGYTAGGFKEAVWVGSEAITHNKSIAELLKLLPGKKVN